MAPAHPGDYHSTLLHNVAVDGSSIADARAPSARVAPTGVTPRSVSGVHVLIVDDSEANRRFASFVCKKLGCSVTAVADGDEVVAALRSAEAAGEVIDVVLMDLVMVRARVLPGVDAFDLIRLPVDSI